jgi:hypothetical protein
VFLYCTKKGRFQWFDIVAYDRFAIPSALYAMKLGTDDDGSIPPQSIQGNRGPYLDKFAIPSALYAMKKLGKVY